MLSAKLLQNNPITETSDAQKFVCATAGVHD